MIYQDAKDMPRPDADLAQVALTLDRCRSITIVVPGAMEGLDGVSSDQAAIGRIFKWLMGQVRLARGE